MKHMATRLGLAMIIGVVLTGMSMSYGQPFVDPNMHCSFGGPVEQLTGQAWYNTANYYAQGYPFTARNEPTATGCDTTKYLWLGTFGDLIVWSSVSLLVSMATYSLLARHGRMSQREEVYKCHTRKQVIHLPADARRGLRIDEL